MATKVGDALKAVRAANLLPGGTAERMANTEPGKLAAALGELLYNSYDQEIAKTAYWTSRKQNGYEGLIRDIRDYLEGLAFKEMVGERRA